MKAYLLVSGTIFALFAATVVVVLYGHWGESGSNLSFLLAHAAIAIGCLALAVWAFRLSRRVSTTVV